jgi:hypothetical protein
MTPDQEPLLQFFATEHLREDLRPIVQGFADLVNEMVNVLPRNPERTMMVRNLMLAKDNAVRAKLWSGDTVRY